MAVLAFVESSSLGQGSPRKFGQLYDVVVFFALVTARAIAMIRLEVKFATCCSWVYM